MSRELLEKPENQPAKGSRFPPLKIPPRNHSAALVFAASFLHIFALGEVITVPSPTPPTEIFGSNKVNYLPEFSNYSLGSGDFSQWTIESNPQNQVRFAQQIIDDQNAHVGKAAYLEEWQHGIRLATPQFTPKTGVVVEARFYNPTGVSSCRLAVYQGNLDPFVDLSTNLLVHYENNSTDQYVTMTLDLSNYAGQSIRVGVAGGKCQVDYVAVYDTAPPDTDRDGIIDAYETGTGTYVSPSNTGSNPNLADTDGDGLNDGDEVNLYSSNPNIKDSDGDGFEDGFEVYTGFNPASAASTPETQSSMLTAVEFRFNAASGQTYRIESSTDLSNWSTVEASISGAGARITRFYSIEGQTRRFYRARRNTP
jgi:hypothetical protein